MEPLSIVVAQRDPGTAQVLTELLLQHVRSVAHARSTDEVRGAIAKSRANMVILDLETVPLSEVHALCGEFGHLSVICTHRLPDDELWTLALSEGADDVCQTNDVAGILVAARHAAQRPRAA